MIYLIEALMPRRVGSFVLLMMGGLCYLLGCILSTPANPGFLLLLAALLGIWLGAWCQDLHLFAGAHRTPRFAPRMLSAYLTVFAVIGLFTTMLMFANREMLVVLPVLLTTIAIASAFTLVIKQYWFVPAMFVCWALMPKTSDTTRETVATLLSTPATSLVASLVLLASLGSLFVLLSRPISRPGISLRSSFDNNSSLVNRGGVGVHGTRWRTHAMMALGLVAVSVTMLHFIERFADGVYVMWIWAIIPAPALYLGRAVHNAPRSWLVGASESRKNLSLTLLLGVLAPSGIYSLAALPTIVIANAFHVPLPANFPLTIMAAFAASALILGLISSFSENLANQKPSLRRWLVIALVVPAIMVLAAFEEQNITIAIAVIAAAAVCFLYKGYRRISNLEFSNY